MRRRRWRTNRGTTPPYSGESANKRKPLAGTFASVADPISAVASRGRAPGGARITCVVPDFDGGDSQIFDLRPNPGQVANDDPHEGVRIHAGRRSALEIVKLKACVAPFQG